MPAAIICPLSQEEMGLGGIVEFYEAQGTMWARFMEEMILSKRGQEHQRLRASVASAFTPRHANVIRPLVQRVASDLLDEWTPKGSFDFTEFASLKALGEAHPRSNVNDLRAMTFQFDPARLDQTGSRLSI